VRILVVGHGSREHAIAKRLVGEGNTLLSFQKRPNIGLEHVCTRSILSDSYDVKK